MLIHNCRTVRSNSSSSSDPEACGVAAREAGQEKAISLLKCALEQEGLSVLSIKALTYPLALSFVLEHGLQARDALHLGVAVIAHATKISTSDADFSDRIEQLGRDAHSDLLQRMRERKQSAFQSRIKRGHRLVPHLLILGRVLQSRPSKLFIGNPQLMDIVADCRHNLSF